MRKYTRSPVDLARRATDTKTRPSAPSSVKRFRPPSIGALGCPGRFFIAGQRTGVIHFHV